MSNRLNHVRKNLEARRKNLNYRIKQKERSAPAAFNRQKYSKGEAGASTHSNIRGGKPVLEDKGFFSASNHDRCYFIFMRRDII